MIASFLWEAVKIAGAILALMFLGWTMFNLLGAMCRVNAVAAARRRKQDEAKHND